MSKPTAKSQKLKASVSANWNIFAYMAKKLNRKAAGVTGSRPIKVLQYGKGNFLRGFADWMIDIANEKSRFNCGVQLVQTNSTTTDSAFVDQEGLFHVVVDGIKGGKHVREVRLITCVQDVLNPFIDFNAYLRAGENPDLRLVISNTTEAGIAFDPNDKQRDVLSSTFPGKLTSLLFHRYRYYGGDPAKGLTILPCELIDKNGEALRTAVLQYAGHWKLESGFESWIRAHTVFCNTLVDRIVPGYPKDTAKDIWEETGFEDQLLVTAEPFHLWMIEPASSDQITLDYLQVAIPLEQAGLNVRFVSDLTPYKTRKVRILNGAHTAMVPVAYLRGLRTVRDAVDDPFVGQFIREGVMEEIIPTLDLLRHELVEFASDVFERFRNPSIRHELKSIALNSISKFQVRVLPSIVEFQRRRGTLPTKLVYSLAALVVFYKGEWRGESLPLNDTPQVLNFFRDVWRKGDVSTVINDVLANEELWKTDLTKIPGLLSAVESYAAEIMSADSQ